MILVGVACCGWVEIKGLTGCVVGCSVGGVGRVPRERERERDEELGRLSSGIRCVLCFGWLFVGGSFHVVSVGAGDPVGDHVGIVSLHPHSCANRRG